MSYGNLDERLGLAFDLYESCGLAADIGTDHAHLPAALLESGKCRRMILTDLSENALAHARETILARGLADRAELRLGNGLEPLREKCAMISVLGMGGRTIRDILLSGRERLHGAGLLLSAHTDLPEVRRAVMDIGYHLVSETPCRAAGRFYLLLKAAPGAETLSEEEVRLGRRLLESDSPLLPAYLARRREIVAERLRGLREADAPDEALIRQAESDLRYYEAHGT